MIFPEGLVTSFSDSDGLDEVDISHNDTPSTMDYAGDNPDLVQARSEDNWVDIDAINTQQPDNPFAAIIQAQTHDAVRNMEAARTTAAEETKRFENMLMGACDERGAANRLCEELRRLHSEQIGRIRLQHRQALETAEPEHEHLRVVSDEKERKYEQQSNIVKAEFERSRTEWQRHEETLRAEMDAERLRYAEAIANAELKYQRSVESSEIQYEELQIIFDQERKMHERQLDLASSDWEIRTKETQQHCEYLRAEMGAERLKHAEAIADAEVKYQAYLEYSGSQYEQLQKLSEQDRRKYDQQLEFANSRYEARIEETQRHCEDLRAEIDEERKKHAEVIEDTRLDFITTMDSAASQHKQEKAGMLEELRRGSEMTERLKAENQDLFKAIGEIEPELSTQLTTVKQRDASIISLKREFALVQGERNSISALWNDLNNKAEAEARRLTSGFDLAVSDKRRLERTVSGLRDQLEHATSGFQSDPANVCAVEEEITSLKARLEEQSAQKTRSSCDSCTRLEWENTELSMTIDGLESELGAARCEAWGYSEDAQKAITEATKIQNELVRTRQEHAIETKRLTTPSDHPLVIRVAALTSEERPEVVLIKMNPDTPFKSILENLRQGHPLKALKVEATGRFVFESDTPDHLSLKDGEILIFFQERDEPKVMLDATMDVIGGWRGKDATI